MIPQHTELGKQCFGLCAYLQRSSDSVRFRLTALIPCVLVSFILSHLKRWYHWELSSVNGHLATFPVKVTDRKPHSQPGFVSCQLESIPSQVEFHARVWKPQKLVANPRQRRNELVLCHKVLLSDGLSGFTEGCLWGLRPLPLTQHLLGCFPTG